MEFKPKKHWGGGFPPIAVGMLQLLSFLPIVPSNSRGSHGQTPGQTPTRYCLGMGKGLMHSPAQWPSGKTHRQDTASRGISRRKILFTSFEQQHSGGHSPGRSCRSKRGHGLPLPPTRHLGPCRMLEGRGFSTEPKENTAGREGEGLGVCRCGVWSMKVHSTTILVEKSIPRGWRHAWSQGFCIYRRVQSLENKCSGSFLGQTQPQAPGWATHGGWMLLCRCPTASGSVIRREPEHSCL